jgi:hypothetical protein
MNKIKDKRFIYFLVASVFIVGCATQEKSTSLVGELNDSRYISPSGNFTLSVEGLDPQIRDSYDEVEGYGITEIRSAMGSIERISYDEESESLMENLKNLKVLNKYKDFMLGYFENAFVPKNYPTESGATIKSEPIFITAGENELLFAIIRVPQGSSVYTTGIRNDGIRGVLLFVENGYSYQLHKETVHPFNLDPSDEDVKRLTLQLYNRITFQ